MMFWRFYKSPGYITQLVSVLRAFKSVGRVIYYCRTNFNALKRVLFSDWLQLAVFLVCIREEFPISKTIDGF